jgi:hypothetical protein
VPQGVKVQVLSSPPNYQTMIEKLRGERLIMERGRFSRASSLLAALLLTSSCAQSSEKPHDKLATPHISQGSDDGLRHYPCPRVLELIREGELTIVEQSPGETKYSYAIELLELPDNAVRVRKFDSEGKKRLQVDFPAEEIELEAMTTFEVPDHDDVSVAISVSPTELPNGDIQTHIDVSVCGLPE